MNPFLIVNYLDSLPMAYIAMRGLIYILIKATGVKIGNSFNFIIFMLIILSIVLSYLIINSNFLPLSFVLYLCISVIIIPLLYLGCYHPLYKELHYDYLDRPKDRYNYILLWIDQNMTIITFYSVIIHIAVKGIFNL